MANLTTESKHAFIRYLKEEGNGYFRNKDWSRSIELYQHCISFLDSIYFDGLSESDDDEKHIDIKTQTSVILSNMAQAHLHAHNDNPDLYQHLFAALNCAQISLRLNSSNTKSTVRRVISLYRMGLMDFADSVLRGVKTSEEAMKPSIPLLMREKKKIENQSVKYHVDRFQEQLLRNNGKVTHQIEEDVDIENNVFLRVAVADLMHRRKYTLHDFIHSYFDRKVQSLQVIAMIGIVLNWTTNRMASQFNIYLAECVGDDALSFQKKKQIIVNTLKMEKGLWPTDQLWKGLVEMIIVDRNEAEWSEILNCSDDGVLNKIYDQYHHKVSVKDKLTFKKGQELKGKGVISEGHYKWIQSELHELKRLHELDKQNIISLSKVIKELQGKNGKLESRIIGLETTNTLQQDVDRLSKKLQHMQIVCGITVAVVAILCVVFR